MVLAISLFVWGSIANALMPALSYQKPYAVIEGLNK